MSDRASQPLVSIVIPHYNRSELLAETLRSMETQQYPNWEIIVVDDGSESDEWTAIQDYANQRIRLMQRTNGLKGPSRCRNLGAAAAKGEFLVFLDSDDVLAPWCLAQRVREARQSPHHDLWVFQVMLFREMPGDLAVCWNRLEGNDDLERFLRSDPPWHTSSPLWRRQSFLALGGFNEKVMYGDDSDLHTKTLLRAAPYVKYPYCLPDAFIRRGSQQRITSRLSSALIESRRVRLTEGNQLLRQFAAPPHARDLWEGQFFVESEELLFNAKEPSSHIAAVMRDWTTLYRPPQMRQWLVQSYFRIGLLFKCRAYWVVRMARRIVMKALPPAYFQSAGHFHKWELNAAVLERIWEELERNGVVSKPADSCQFSTFAEKSLAGR